MRYSLELEDGRLEYGHDEALGFFSSRFDIHGSEIDYYNALTPEYDHERPLHSLLTWMAHRLEIFDENDLEAGFEWLLQHEDDEPPEHLRVLIEVLDNLRVAAECR